MGTFKTSQGEIGWMEIILTANLTTRSCGLINFSDLWKERYPLNGILVTVSRIASINLKPSQILDRTLVTWCKVNLVMKKVFQRGIQRQYPTGLVTCRTCGISDETFECYPPQ